MVRDGTVKLVFCHFLLESTGLDLQREQLEEDMTPQTRFARPYKSLPDWIDTFPWDTDEQVTDRCWEEVFAKHSGGDFDTHISLSLIHI